MSARNPSATLFFAIASTMRPCSRVPGLAQCFDLLSYLLNRMLYPSIAKAIDDVQTQAAGWPLVTVRGHRFGGAELRICGQNSEFGHIHGSGVVDIKLPPALKARIDPSTNLLAHHVHHKSTVWATYIICGKQDALTAVYLLRLSYEAALLRPHASTAEVW